MAPLPEVRLTKIAIIDDDEAVHEGTRFALAGYSLHGCGLDILSAYSAAQARDLLAAHPDTAVILLDVVMETDTAGLDLVGYIREVLGNETVRIILRTGQPGQAPERDVVLRYRYQRLQGEDRADGRQALHRAHRGPAELRAASSHQRDQP